MVRTFATIGVLCWLAIKAAIDPRLIAAMLMIAAVHLAAWLLAALVLAVAWLVGAG